jgi:Fe-S-cluster containining protein
MVRESLPGGGMFLCDPITDLREELDAGPWELVRHMDGARRVRDIARDLAPLGVTPELIGRAARRIEAYLFCETAWVRKEIQSITAHRRAVGGGEGETLPIAHLPDSFWACTQCGFCCHFGAIGPVSSGVVEGLNAAIREERLTAPTGVDPFLWENSPGKPEAAGWYLNHTDDHCLFLDDDDLCRIHRALGPEAKPIRCRAFPRRLIHTYAGFDFAMTLECLELWRTFQRPCALDEEVASLRYLATRALKTPPIDRPVDLLGGELISYAVYREVESAFLHVAAWPAGRLDEKLGILADLTAQIYRNIVDVPCRVQPVVEWWASAVRRLKRYPGEGPGLRKRPGVVNGLRGLSHRLLEALPALRKREDFARALDSLRAGKGPRQLDDPRGGEGAERTPSDPELLRFERFQLRELIFGKVLLQERSLAAGLGKLILFWALQEGLAFAEAAKEGSHGLTARHLNVALVAIHSAFRSPEFRRFFDGVQRDLEMLCIGAAT